MKYRFLNRCSDFLKGSGATLRLAIPLIAAQVATVALGLIDTATFAHLGTLALAGGGLGIAAFSLIHIVCVGILAAVGNEVAFSYGANDHEGIRSAVSAGALIAITTGIGATLLIWFTPPVLLHLGQSVSSVDHASIFLMSAAPGIIASLLFTNWRGLAVGMSKPGPITFITCLSVLFKISINALIIYKTRNLSEKDRVQIGLLWCGLANSLTYIFMALLLWLFCHRHFSNYLAFPNINKFSRGRSLEILKLGVPIGVTYGVESGFFTGIALIVGKFGDIALAAHQIANQCVYLTFMLAVGLSHATSVRAGSAAGAGNLAEARRICRQTLLIGLLMMALTAVIFTFFGNTMARLLVGEVSAESKQVISLAAQLLMVAACFQWADGTQNIAMGALRGLKHSRSAMIVGIVGYWAVGLPAAVIFSVIFEFGPIGAWWGLGAGLATSAVLLVIKLECVTGTSVVNRTNASPISG